MNNSTEKKQDAQAKKGTSLNQSTKKTLSIIEILANAQKPMRLQEIAEALEYNNSTTLRFLRALEECGYVSQDEESGKYFLTFKICWLANSVVSFSELNVIVQPYLQTISRKLTETVCMAVEQEKKAVYIATANGPDNILTSMRYIGKVAPLYCTGVGKLMMLEWSDEELEDYFTHENIEVLTRNTIITPADMKQELKKIRECGYAIDNEECEIGATCIAFPIWNYTGHIIAGISLTGPSRRIMEKMSQVIEELEKTSKEISRFLGYGGEFF